MKKTHSPRFGKHTCRSWRQKWKYTALSHENAEETAGQVRKEATHLLEELGERSHRWCWHGALKGDQEFALEYFSPLSPFGVPTIVPSFGVCLHKSPCWCHMTLSPGWTRAANPKAGQHPTGVFSGHCPIELRSMRKMSYWALFNMNMVASHKRWLNTTRPCSEELDF